MRATFLHGPGDVRLETVADPTILRPTDAIVRIVASCVCGSDLWSYRGVRTSAEPRAIGHELVGVVTEVGSDVTSVREGQVVIAPFSIGCGECVHCRNGVHTSCVRLSWWGGDDHEGLPTGAAQAEAVRVPLANGTLVPVDGVDESVDESLLASLLTLSDVMGTGHHAARSARVSEGDTVVVVGDGAVGLCAVLASARLGAERVVVMSRTPARADLARRFGATDVVAERGADGVARVLDLLDGVGADAVLECVGTKESMNQATGSARPGGRVGFVGVPAGGPELDVGRMFSTNVSVAGGVAPVRGYIPELLTDVLAGTIEPGRVFDDVRPLADVAGAYAAMDERRAIKSMLRP